LVKGDIIMTVTESFIAELSEKVKQQEVELDLLKSQLKIREERIDNLDKLYNQKNEEYEKLQIWLNQ
jgi:uncharacterized coiled-coil protein SlyX